MNQRLVLAMGKKERAMAKRWKVGDRRFEKFRGGGGCALD
jgi:hypothetical protein